MINGDQLYVIVFGTIAAVVCWYVYRPMIKDVLAELKKNKIKK